jgi:hypothetical protein
MKIAVVGAGFSGLYATWLLKGKGAGKAIQVDVFEAGKDVGGRARQIRFGKRLVAGGAGIGRFDKDRRLKRLLSDLGIKTSVFHHQVHYWPRRPTTKFIKTFIKFGLAKLKRGKPGNDETFRDYAYRTLGKSRTDKLIQYLGFSDDMQADAAQTLKHYGFEDNFSLGKGIRVPWNKALRVLESRLKEMPGVRIFKSHRVRRIIPSNGSFSISVGCSCKGSCFARTSRSSCSSCFARTVSRCFARTSRCSSSRYDHVLLAGTYDSNLRILRPKGSGVSSPTFRANIRSQPFLYVYADVAKGLSAMREAVPGYTVLTDVKDKGARLLQKMIPMGGRTFMVCYADNESAKELGGMSAARIARLARDTLRLPPDVKFSRVLKKPIPVGTHYFKPNPRLTRTQVLDRIQEELGEGVTIIGEAVSLHNQGWVEGALEAAERGVNAITKTWT